MLVLLVTLVRHNGKAYDAYLVAIVTDHGVTGEHHKLGTHL